MKHFFSNQQWKNKGDKTVLPLDHHIHISMYTLPLCVFVYVNACECANFNNAPMLIANYKIIKESKI